MKTITIDDQKYELVPIPKYKPKDWIIFELHNGEREVRRIATDKEYDTSINSSKELDSKYYTWMTKSASEQYGTQIKRRASQKEIEEHLIKVARSKGFKADIRLKGIGKDDFHKAVQNTIDYFIDDDLLSMSGMIIYKDGEWAEIEKEPIFTFGGYPVEFDVKASHAPKGIEVTIKCKGVTGNATEIANILTHFFRPMPFGSVVVTTWVLKGGSSKIIPAFEANENATYVDTITIGCLTGKYTELEVIYNKSQDILKNWKPAKNFDK